MNAFERFFKTGTREEPTDTEAEQINKGVVDKRIRGKIFKINPKGYGFITSQEIPFIRIFFHWTELNTKTLNFADLRRGMEVEFTPVELETNNWRAIRINVIERE